MREKRGGNYGAGDRGGRGDRGARGRRDGRAWAQRVNGAGGARGPGAEGQRGRTELMHQTWAQIMYRYIIQACILIPWVFEGHLFRQYFEYACKVKKE